MGNITSITGLGGTFVPYPAGVKAYFEYRNDNGGIDGHPVEFIEKDDAADASENAVEARELIGEGIVATVGDATVGSSGGGAPALQEAGIAAIGGNANGPEWFGQFDNLFQLVSGGATPEKCSPRGSTEAVNEGSKNVAIVQYNIPAGEINAECMKQGLERLGAKVATGESLLQEPGQAELRPLIQKIISSGAEGVLLGTSSADMVSFIQAADQLGYEGVVYGENGMSPEVLAGIGPIADKWDGRIFGFAFALPPDEKNPELTHFRKYITPKFSENYLATAGWAAGMMFANAVEEAGTGHEEILEYMKGLEGYDAKGMIAPVHYAKGLNPTGCGVEVVNEGGKRFVRAPHAGEGFSCAKQFDASK